MRLYAILLGVFLVLILFVFFVDCNATLETNVKESIDMGHKIIFRKGDLAVEKATIEGHEYLLFYGKLSAPSVVHNENCPCKN